MVNINIGLMLGSYAKVAYLLDEMATIPGLAGALLTFDEFVTGTQVFGGIDCNAVHPGSIAQGMSTVACGGSARPGRERYW